MSQTTFKTAYHTLQKHAETLRNQQEPNIDDLLKIVTESVEAYNACKERIDAVEQAIAAGVDAYLTGEVSERTFHEAQENGISFFAAGHHATERYGVQALGEWLVKRFGIEHHYVECDNPV